MYAQVCFPFFLNKTFTYKVPVKFQDMASPGVLVNVKFKNKDSKGFLVSTSNRVHFKGQINSIISIENQIPQELWHTIEWMSKYYVTPIGKITQTVLSWAFKDNSIKRKSLIKEIKTESLDSFELTHSCLLYTSPSPRDS